jgi:hypothetical protein
MRPKSFALKESTTVTVIVAITAVDMRAWYILLDNSCRKRTTKHKAAKNNALRVVA